MTPIELAQQMFALIKDERYGMATRAVRVLEVLIDQASQDMLYAAYTSKEKTEE